MSADFPDWLSPMLVKELRQGMRSRLYLTLFILVQVAMIFLALAGLMEAAVDSPSQGITVFYWIIIVVPLLIIMPAAGLGAISAEKSGNTLEPIFLTRLTARRVIAGKWVAMIAQTLLLVTSILPYMVLRYYLGGVDLVTELEALGWLLAGSTLLIAIAVGLSPGITRVGRVVIPIALIICLLIGSEIVSDGRNGLNFQMNGNLAAWETYGMVVLLGCVLAGLMLELGAGKIAPAAENHSTLKRLLGLAAAVLAIAYSYQPGAYDWMWTPALVIVGLTLMVALCEPVCEIPSVYRSFVRAGFPGRAMGRLLYPGWPSGVFLSLLLAGMVIFRLNQVSVAHGQAAGDGWLWLRIMEIAPVGALLLPTMLYRMFRLKRVPAPVFFFAVQGLFALVALLAAITHPSNSQIPTDFELVLGCIPFFAILYGGVIGSWNSTAQGLALAEVTVTSVTLILIMLVQMTPAWRAISVLEKKAAEMESTNSPTDTDQPSASA